MAYLNFGRETGGVVVVGSNPATPTIFFQLNQSLALIL